MKRVREWQRAIMSNRSGMTLIEVLAGIVILAIVGTALLTYFTNAYSYTKGNQNKTVAVNLARHSLVYFERQNFQLAKDWLTEKDDEGNYVHHEISMEVFRTGNQLKDNDEIDSRLRGLFPDNDTAKLILEPIVNGIVYDVIIRLDVERMIDFGEGESKANLVNLLLPIKVEVADQQSLQRNKSEVEGYITHEEIR